MRKLLVIFIILLFTGEILFSQTFEATLGIDNVTVSKLKEGDSITIPLRLLELSGGKITGFQLFIDFDHSLFKWMGTWEKPSPGVSNLHKNLPLNNVNWVLNDNGNQVVAIWYDPTLKGQEIKENEIILEVKFLCLKTLESGYQSFFRWGEDFEESEGRVVKGVTELYSDIPDLYTLKKVNGFIKAK